MYLLNKLIYQNHKLKMFIGDALCSKLYLKL